MYSRTIACGLVCRRTFSTAKNNVIKRCTPVFTQTPRSFLPAPQTAHRPAALESRAAAILRARFYSTSSGVEEDPERKGLYYHPVGNNVFALSFLEDKPPSHNSATVIGFVKGGDDSNSFQENQAFVDLLHETIKAALIEGVDQELGNDAVQRKEGWLHVHGKSILRCHYRNFPEMGRVGSPADILGSVLVQDGKIKGETYERMPSYRTCTTDGPVKLSPSLHERLLKSLKEARQKETSA